MALNVELLRREAKGAIWVSPARVCLTADGALVSCEDASAVKLLVGVGGALPVAKAELYGLVARPGAKKPAAADEPVEEKAQEPLEDKQVAAPENKRLRSLRK